MEDQYNEYKTTAPLLQFNLLHIIQSFQMFAFPNPVLLLLLLMPCVWGKCIFDEVQSSIRVLSPPDNQLSSSNDVKHEGSVNEQEDWLTQVKIQNHQNGIAQYSPSQRSKRMDRDRIKIIAKPQPIRIKTWTSRDSPVLSQRETERLEAAVGDAISIVSKLLSGIVSVCRDLNTKTTPHIPTLTVASQAKAEVCFYKSLYVQD